MFILGLLLALFVGLLLGILGGGGSTLAVPVFVYCFDFNAKTAVGMSLFVVGITSFFGSISHWRRGNINLRISLSFGAIAMGGAYMGAHLAFFLSGSTQLMIFAFVVLVSSYFMYTDKKETLAENTVDGTCGNEISFLLIVASVFVGLLTGLVGVGGGFLIVPVLVLLAKVPIKEAVGTSLAVIVMNCIAGFLGYLHQITMPWKFVFGFTAIAITGVLIGSYLVKFICPKKLKKTFALFLIAMGIFIVYKNHQAFLYLFSN